MTGQWGADANILGWQHGDIGGVGTGGASLAEVHTYLIDTYLSDGLGPYGKFFDGGAGWHATYTSFAGSGYGDKANERHPVICAKAHTTASFNTLMTDMAAALPTGEIWYACFYSEPEAGFNAGTLTHSAYQSTWASMNTLRAAHPHGAQVKFIPILMAFQEISGTSHWADFLTPVLAVADVIGWDVYDDNGDPQSWSFEDDIYPAIQALQTTSGLPWSIPEYGLQVSTHSGSTDNTAGVLSRWQDMVAVCEADPDFLWGNYWLDGPHAPNQRSAVIRTDTASAAYLASLVAGASPLAWLATDGAHGGNYQGAWLKLLSTTTIADIPSDALWSPPAPASDNRTDGTGFLLELDLFVGDPGNPAHIGYGFGGGQPWDHNDRFTTYTDIASDGTPDVESPGVLIPAGTEIWLVAAQWPDGHSTPLPLDAPLAWDPMTDTGTWTLADGTTPLIPWDTLTPLEFTDPPAAPVAGISIDLKWSFDVTVPGYVSTGTVDENSEDAWALDLEWSFIVDLEPAVMDMAQLVDLTYDPAWVARPDNEWVPDIPWIERVSETYGAPDLVGGRPKDWEPTDVLREDWGVLQLIIGGRDLSRPRGKRFIPLTDRHTEPFGDANAAFAFPGISDFDNPSDFGITRFAHVKFRRRKPDRTYVTLYEGVIGSLDGDSGQGLTIQCVGSLGRADLLTEPPELWVEAKDCGKLIAEALNRKRRLYALPIGQMAHHKTGIQGTSNTQFAPLVSGAIQDWLSTMTDDDGNQYTLTVVNPRTPVLRVKDLTTVDYTVVYNQRGVQATLSKDYTTATSAVFGDGSNGHKQWMGARFPNLTQGDTPSFPLPVGAVFTAGGSHAGFAPFAAFLRRGQYGSIASGDTYLAADIDNVKQMQDRAGITVDGVVGAQTWEAAFQPGFNQGSVRGAYVDTIYELAATTRYKFNAQGAKTGRNPHFDPSVPRIEDYIPFGEHTPKNLARRSAKQIINWAHPTPLTGTIVLVADPQECSRWNMQSGRNIRVKHFRGGDVLLHIVDCERNWQTGTVTLTVDEAGRDRLTVAAIHQRKKEVSDLTRRQTFGRTRSRVFNDYGQWLEEDGAGEIPVMNQQGGFWNVQQIAAGPQGSIQQIALAIGTGLTEKILAQVANDNPPKSIPGAGHGCMMICTRPITARQITNMAGMSTPGNSMDDGTNPWDHNEDRLTRHFGKIYAAGGPGQQIGFYPKSDPGDGTGATGLHYDGGGVTFGPTGHYWLWIAIWTPMSTKVGGKLFPGAPS